MTTGPSPPAPSGPRRPRFQVGLRMVFWLVAATAVWLTVRINRSESEALRSKIQRTRPIARDLVVDDPTRIAVVKLDDLWSDELRWDVHLPPGRFVARLATREVDDKGFPPTSRSAPIGPGRHRLSLLVESLKSGKKVRFQVDGADLLTADEPDDWAGSGWTSRGGFSTSEQLAADKPVEFHRRRFSKSDASGRNVRPAGPSDGLMLWIEPEAAPPEEK